MYVFGVSFYLDMDSLRREKTLLERREGDGIRTEPRDGVLLHHLLKNMAQSGPQIL